METMHDYVNYLPSSDRLALVQLQHAGTREKQQAVY